MRDIANLDDIKIVVDGFYHKVQEDDLIGPVFALRIASNEWEKHLTRMYDFWNTVLFFQRSYKGNPFSKHVDLPIEQIHFDQWTSLFKATIDQHFQGEKADEAKRRVDLMAKLFMAKLDHIRKHPNYKSIM